MSLVIDNGRLIQVDIGPDDSTVLGRVFQGWGDPVRLDREREV